MKSLLTHTHRAIELVHLVKAFDKMIMVIAVNIDFFNLELQLFEMSFHDS